jgi:hypothetical protein
MEPGNSENVLVYLAPDRRLNQLPEWLAGIKRLDYWQQLPEPSAPDQ